MFIFFNYSCAALPTFSIHFVLIYEMYVGYEKKLSSESVVVFFSCRASGDYVDATIIRLTVNIHDHPEVDDS